MAQIAKGTKLPVIHSQMSETLGLGILLAVSGGLMDSYSYLCRGHVFANAQTGNIVLFSVNLSQGNWNALLPYLCPVAAFSLGIAIANILRNRRARGSKLHWRQVGVFVEMLLLMLVAFMPQRMNLAANSLTSLACGFQVESFRSIRGNSIATTMCIGNLRSAIHAATEYRFTGDHAELKHMAVYFIIIAAFSLGAVAGSGFIALWQERAIFASSALLFFCFLLMFIPPEQNVSEKKQEGME